MDMALTVGRGAPSLWARPRDVLGVDVDVQPYDGALNSAGVPPGLIVSIAASTCEMFS
jgi:hypothetical protein